MKKEMSFWSRINVRDKLRRESRKSTLTVILFLFFCHSRGGGNPESGTPIKKTWIPICMGMTTLYGYIKFNF